MGGDGAAGDGRKGGSQSPKGTAKGKGGAPHAHGGKGHGGKGHKAAHGKGKGSVGNLHDDPAAFALWQRFQVFLQGRRSGPAGMQGGRVPGRWMCNSCGNPRNTWDKADCEQCGMEWQFKGEVPAKVPAGGGRNKRAGNGKGAPRDPRPTGAAVAAEVGKGGKNTGGQARTSARDQSPTRRVQPQLRVQPPARTEAP